MANKERIKPRSVKRSDSLADDIRRKIYAGEIKPGEAVLQEKDLLNEYRVSKGTAREALKSLEVQGLVRIKTGPGGGASVTEVGPEKASELLWNYFSPMQVTLPDIYQVRRVLEPALVRHIINDLGREDFERLERHVEKSATAKQPALAIDLALQFHEQLADLCSNRVLGFYVMFAVGLVRKVLADDIPKRATKDVRDILEHGLENYRNLIQVLKSRDADAAAQLIEKHVNGAERMVLKLTGVS